MGEADESAPGHERGTESASTGDATDEIAVATATTDEAPIERQSGTPAGGAALPLQQSQNLLQQISLQ